MDEHQQVLNYKYSELIELQAAALFAATMQRERAMNIEEKIKFLNDLIRKRDTANNDMKFVEKCRKGERSVAVGHSRCHWRHLENYGLKDLGDVVFDALARKIEKRLVEIEDQILKLS